VIVAHLLKKNTQPLCGTSKFISVFTRAWYWTTIRVRWIKYTTSHPTQGTSFSSTPVSSQWSLSYRLLDKHSISVACVPHAPPTTSSFIRPYYS